MRVDADASARVFGNTVDAAFEDMDAQGEHGLASTLVATALAEVADAGPDQADVVGTILARVADLVAQYETRTVPIEYV